MKPIMIQVIVDTDEETAWMQEFLKGLSTQQVDYFHSGSVMEKLGLEPTKTGYRIYLSEKIEYRFKTAKRHDDTN